MAVYMEPLGKGSLGFNSVESFEYVFRTFAYVF